jgi:hypothetical protein
MILSKYLNRKLKVVYQEDKTETVYGNLLAFDEEFLEIELDVGKVQLVPRNKVYKIIPRGD